MSTTPPTKETYIELRMDGFNPLVLRHQDTLRTVLEIMTGADWDTNAPIEVVISPVEMTPKDFEELPEWEG